MAGKAGMERFENINFVKEKNPNHAEVSTSDLEITPLFSSDDVLEE